MPRQDLKIHDFPGASLASFPSASLGKFEMVVLEAVR